MKFSCLSAGCAITPHLESARVQQRQSPRQIRLMKAGRPLAAPFLFGAAPQGAPDPAQCAPLLARCRRVINFGDGPPLNWYFCEVWIGPWETDETADGVVGTGIGHSVLTHSRS
jgi:hypothetical protein